MQFGVVFPQTEYGSDPSAIRDYAQAAEDLGYSHITAYDHVLGANPERPGGWSGPYTFHSTFQEPFLLFSYMSGVTSRLGFATGVVILPQRQTALVAKQAANLDILCGGRFRLGVGLGWNEVEYIALDENFHNRGRRIEEQVAVLRLLWTQPLVNYEGRWHTIQDAGINPLPIQQPIPIWFGGRAEQAMKRIAQIADGWIVNIPKAADAHPQLDTLHRYMEEIGRDRSSLGIEARIQYGDGNPDTWNARIQEWQAEGTDYFQLNTMGSGLSSAEHHLEALEVFAGKMGLKPG